MRTEKVLVGTGLDRGRLREAIERGIDEVVLTATTRALPSSLHEVVADASAAGCRVVLDAEPAAFDEALAERLHAAGLALARLRTAAMTHELAGAIAALARAGVAVELSMPLVRSSLRSVARVPEELVARLGATHGVSAIRVSVPLDARDRTELVSYADAAPHIRALYESAVLAHVPVTLADGDSMPPCVLENSERYLSLFRLESAGASRPGFVRLPPCDECAVAAACPGLEERYVRQSPAHDLFPVRAIHEKRPAPSAELVRREGDRHVVSVVYHCDQACAFCWVPTYAPPPSDADVREAITRAGHGGAGVVLSGGEPTLHPSLAEYVRLARDATSQGVWIETNAVALGDPGRARDLAAAGIERAIVSLHGSRAEIADAVTRSPGAFERTTAGIDRLHEAGVAVTLRFVVCEANLGDLEAYVRTVATRWPHASIDVTLVEHRSDLVPRTPQTVMRHSDLLPALARARQEATRLGVRADWPSLDGRVPLCVPDADPSAAPRPSPDHLKVAHCRSCSRDPECPGIERTYAHLHGLYELRRIPSAS